MGRYQMKETEPAHDIINTPRAGIELPWPNIHDITLGLGRD